jgi:hypothetical protein
MTLRLIPLLLLAAPALAQSSPPAPAQPPVARPGLTPELQMSVRCAALFAIVAGEQARGVPGDWPPLGARAREFFVQVSARAMDAGGLDRTGIQALMQAEVAALQDAAIANQGTVGSAASLKAPCLALLDAALPVASDR